MHTTTKIACDIDRLSLIWWDKEGKQFIAIGLRDDVEAACNALGCPKEMLKAMLRLVADIKRTVSGDLQDIWQRLDQIEALIQKEE